MLEHLHHAGLWRSSSTTLSILARGLAQLDTDIAALSKVCFAEKGSLRENGAGCTLFWSWKNKNDPCLPDVGFLIKNSIARKLQNLQVGHSDHIMSLRLPVQNSKFATSLVCMHQAEIGVKEAFYCDLHNLLRQVDSKLLSLETSRQE